MVQGSKQLNCIDITDDFFLNNQGCYRWNKIRAAYFNEFINVDRVVDLYKKWKDQTEYLWLDGLNINGEYVASLFVKASKRGNDVYRSRLKKKFDFLESLDPIYFFGDWGSKNTPMLFITPTVDAKRYSLDEAWEKISNELHMFETKLRQQYGSFIKFRVWEAHESGYPHCHVVYYFHDKWFHVFEHWTKKKNKQGELVSKLTYRVANKHKNKISSFWSMGNVDVQGVQDTHGAFSEVKKYITKNIWSSKGDLTNAMICLHRKQSYGISLCDPYQALERYYQKHNITDWKEQERLRPGLFEKFRKKDFIGSIWGMKIYQWFYNEANVNLAEPGFTDLVKDSVHNCNKQFPEIVDFRFRGCVAYADMLQFMPDLSDDWVIIADPPPEMKFILGFYSDEIKFNKDISAAAAVDPADIICCRCWASIEPDVVRDKNNIGFCPHCCRESEFVKRGDIS